MTEETVVYGTTPAAEPTFTEQETGEMLGAAWDGKKRIESPFVAGDYLEVADRPRVSGREARLLWEWPTFGNTAADVGRMSKLLGRIFSGWRLTGMDGAPIAGPGDAGMVFEDLPTRTIVWVQFRAIKVILRNPLA